MGPLLRNSGGHLSGVSASTLLLCLLVESVDERGVLGLEVDDEAILWVRPVLRNAREGEGDLISEGAHHYFVAEGPFVYGYQNGVSYFAYGLMGKDDLFKSGGADSPGTSHTTRSRRRIASPTST